MKFNNMIIVLVNRFDNVNNIALLQKLNRFKTKIEESEKVKFCLMI